MLDRSIGMILPFFITIDGETHHPQRYDRAPRMLAIGTQPTRDPSAVAVFEGMTARHALNMHASAFATGVVAADEGPEAIEVALAGLLARVGIGGDQAATTLISAEEAPEARVGLARLLEVAAAASAPVEVPRHALLLVGSPRGTRSTSASLGGYLMKRLEGAGLTTSTMTVREALAEDGGRERLEAAIRGSDLLVLAFPLYVDSVPAPLIRVFEQMAADPVRPTGVAGAPGAPGTGADAAERRPSVVALVNSGFPEVHQNTYALAVSRRFAEETGACWAGGLALGGGGAVNGQDLEAAGGRARNVRLALDQAAAALASGDPVPAEAIELMARPMMPAFLYRQMANYGFRRTGKKNGVRSQLRDQPYAGAGQR